jgi:hypothetical protein
MSNEARSQSGSPSAGEPDHSGMGLLGRPQPRGAHQCARYYRLHDNRWISVVTQQDARAFLASIVRAGETRALQAGIDLASAKQFADAAVPLRHVCSNGCTAWFEIVDVDRRTDFTATCPRCHSGTLTYAMGDALFRLNTLSFWCLECGRSWPATNEQGGELLARVLHPSADGAH